MKVRSLLSFRFHTPLAICVVGVILQAQQIAPATVHGIIVADIDRSVKSGDNFFEYSNGTWLQKTVIPPDRAAVSVFTVLT